MESVLTSEQIETESADAHGQDRTVLTPGAEVFINKAAKAILVAIGLAVLLATWTAAGIGENAGAEGARLGGDFPAFYAAGSIVWEGDIDSLYDPARQQAAQDELGLDGYLAFAYPPHVAVAYAPLGALSFQAAYLLHTIAMGLAFGLAVHLIAPMAPLLQRWKWPLVAASFTFLPLISAVGGGQNAAFSVLVLAVVWRSLHDGHDVVAGVAIGLLVFRPQYAIPMIGLVLLARHWRTVASALGTIAATWVLTAAVRGTGWFSAWWEQVGPFIERDAEVNAANSISFLGFLHAVLPAASWVAVFVGVVLSVGVVLTLMHLWSEPDRFSLASRMGAAAIGLILISPHTMFYDASLLLIAGGALLAESTSVPVRGLAALWLGATAHVLSDSFGATPLIFVVVVAFCLFVARAVSNSAPLGTSPREEFV